MPWATAARKYFNVPSITLSLIILACRTLYKMHNQVMYFVLHSIHGLVIKLMASRGSTPVSNAP